MKKTLLSLAIILSSTLILNAQKFEGKITYEIEYNELPEALEAYESMLPKEMTTIVKGTKSRIDQNSMGGSTSVISDSKDNSGVMLMNMMGKKIAVKMDAADLEKEKAKAPKTTTKITKETKTIAGYKCTKAAVTSDDGTEVEIWFTDEIPALGGANNKTGADIPGFPMQYTVNSNTGGMEMSMTMTVTKVKKEKIAKSTFEIPEDYKLQTMEELKESFGGMGM